MSPFEYLVGIHTIVLGLGMAYLLTTIADTIKYRDTLATYWVHTTWCVLLLLLLIAWWYGLWRQMSGENEFTYAKFLPEFGFTVSLFLAARFLTIDIEGDRHTSLVDHFARVRVPFFLFLMIPFLIALADSWIGQLESTPADIASLGVQIVVPLIGMLVANERVQKILVFAYGVPFLVVELQQYGVGAMAGG